MGHYKSNVRDQVFNLFEVLGVDKALGQGSFADLDVETAVELGCERAQGYLIGPPRARSGILD